MSSAKGWGGKRKGAGRPTRLERAAKLAADATLAAKEENERKASAQKLSKWLGGGVTTSSSHPPADDGGLAIGQ